MAICNKLSLLAAQERIRSHNVGLRRIARKLHATAAVLHIPVPTLPAIKDGRALLDGHLEPDPVIASFVVLGPEQQNKH